LGSCEDSIRCPGQQHKALHCKCQPLFSPGVPAGAVWLRVQSQQKRKNWGRKKRTTEGRELELREIDERVTIAGHLSLTPVILATQEAEIRKIKVQSQQIVLETLS
jgi:hypothetical protein